MLIREVIFFFDVNWYEIKYFFDQKNKQQQQKMYIHLILFGSAINSILSHTNLHISQCDQNNSFFLSSYYIILGIPYIVLYRVVL